VLIPVRALKLKMQYKIIPNVYHIAFIYSKCSLSYYSYKVSAILHTMTVALPIFYANNTENYDLK